MDSALVAMAMMQGLTSAIVNPNDLRLMETIKSCDVFKRKHPVRRFLSVSCNTMHKVTFKFENSEDVTVFAAFGESLLEVARKTNVAIDAPCGGNGACGKCKVKLMGGTLDSKKTSHISDEEYAAGWRLACISKIIDDVEVLVPDIASAYKSRMKMADLSSAEEVKIFEELKEQIAEVGIQLKNNLEVIDVTMSAPTLDDTMPDNERLIMGCGGGYRYR